MNEQSGFPSTELAYDWVEVSYEWSMRRLDAANGRLERLLGLIVAFTLAVPAAGRAVIGSDVAFNDPFFIIALLFFVLAIVVGLIGWHRGELRLPSPAVLHEAYLSEPPGEFQQKLIYTAGEDIEANHDAVICKSWLFLTSAALAGLEVMFFVLWLAYGAAG